VCCTGNEILMRRGIPVAAGPGGIPFEIVVSLHGGIAEGNMAEDYYKTLGLNRDASQDEIRKAYREMARKYHPDVSKEANAEARFKEVGEAYEVLKDAEKRAAYDKLGANWKAGQEFRPPPDWDSGFEFSGGGFTGGDASGFSDFFESLYGRSFGGGARGHAAFHAQGEDHHAKVQIDLEDAYTGAARTITLQVPGVDAQGHLTTRSHKLKVSIPRGICAGQHIRLVGQGGPGRGQGQAGDLYLEVEFRSHPHYRVEQRDVYLDLPVAAWEAALGAEVAVPTPEGDVKIKLPPKSHSGKRLRIPGRGLPKSSGSRGDLYAVIEIDIPDSISSAKEELFRKLRDSK